MSATTAPKNLYQKLAAIADEVSVKATGRTAQGQQTISIKDTEDAIGELTAKHGVVTGYRWNARPEVVAQEGRLSIWLCDITAWLVNADDPSDIREAQLFDVGSSPSAAVSFALKRYYRALFHLAAEEDETRAVGGGRERRQSSAPADTKPPTSGVEACGKCGVVGAIHRLANAPPGSKVAFCKRDDGGCGAYLTEDQVVKPEPAGTAS